MTATQAIKKYCKEFCCNGMDPRVNCVSETCPLFCVRVGGKGSKSKLKLIRERCKNCVGTGSSKDVSDCTSTTCFLFQFRFAKNPNVSEETKQKRRDKMTPEKRERASERMKSANEKRKKIDKIKQIISEGGTIS